MSRITRFKQARNFVVYYGQDSDWHITGYDLAVVESAGYRAGEIQRLQESGTLVLAYQSFLEIPPWSDILRFLDEDDYLQINGEKVLNPEYQNYCADLRSPKWQRILLSHISEFLEHRGYDGIFLDTIGFLEDQQFPPALRQEQIARACEILEKIKTVFPDHILLQNYGIIDIIRYTYPLIDGVCWENPPLESESLWIDKFTDNLTTLQKDFGIKVFLLLENTDIQSTLYTKVKSYAEKKSFLLYNATNGYTKKPLI